ncbi:circularly permuted type 2 ATP-grasp protein [Bowmanella dokdonensis]|uniref:Circularly permuted type 2 ATP-grasp protein n=1 Tax=Bowmanella dokdonensis TaxID=751969 RepID=A0A939DPH5_9ALTE|nr:circularly permuted type 2 ATP-grasp protein [Bowmanella dokdonensis]MBN7825561.1 circularly permuted type 2 ATP-grasp protein [Bowmanella dokdonensis]
MNQTAVDKHPELSLPGWLSQFLQDQMSGSGNVPGPLASLFGYLAGLSAEDISHRATEIRRLLKNSGFLDTRDQHRSPLDPLPMLISEADWHFLERGIRQRAKLLQTVLQDLMGNKTLLSEGLINPSHLFQHPLYLRESYSLPAEEQGLFVLAMDIGRDQSGRWFILDDHCQVPLGLGLLLENRIVSRRVMSEVFAECGVQRIASFLQQIQQAIGQSTRSLRDPRVVILTPGPEDPNYSEHAYLATYLGYTLVRGADLTVRKGKVWMKSLDGLRKVDVIVRWLEDRYLDPLEQADYSLQGVPGLLQAVRMQTVKLLNPLGSSLLNIPTVRTQLPALAERLSGEPLLLSEPECVAAGNLERQYWRDYEFHSYLDPQVRLDGERQREAMDKLSTGQLAEGFFRRKVTLESAPFLHKRQLTARPVFLRCYALCQPESISVMPSALCLAANGQGIKDTWAQTAAPMDLAPLSLPKPRKLHDLALVEGLIPSRTAENLYWLGCYLERCEDICRLLRLFIDRFTELAIYPDAKNRIAVARLKAGIEQHSLLYPYHSLPAEGGNPGTAECKKLAQASIGSSELAGSLYNTLDTLLKSAMQARELLSYDSLRIIESLETEMHRLEKTGPQTATHMMQSALDRIVGQLMAFNGSVLDSMSNSNGWFMLDIGRRVERSRQLSAMVEGLLCESLPEAEQQSVLEAVLVAQVSSVTHRRRYRMYQSVETGLELLLLDAEYPRSLAYQTDKLVSLCRRLPAKNKPGFMSATQKALLRLTAECSLVERDELFTEQGGERPALRRLMQSIRHHLDALQEILQVEYFSHTRTSRKLSWSSEKGEPV